LEALISLVFTLVIFAVSMLFVVVFFALTIGLTFGMIYLSLKNGGTVVVSSPLLALAQQAQAASAGNMAGAPKRTKHVKVSTCSACGGAPTRPPKTAYVYCEYCGQLMDWDFQAAMADRRSKKPGPVYEGLVRAKASKLEEARAAGDVATYTEIQRELFDKFAELCPAALSPRIGDPVYRKHWLDWTAKSQALQDIDPSTQKTFADQQSATARLVWDRSNPFQPKVQADSFWQLLDAVIAHQHAVSDLVVREGLLESHPDQLSEEILRQMGLSAMVQGWMQYLPPSEHDPLLKKTGLDGTWIEPPEVDLTHGACPSCSAPLDVHPDAKRVVCESCGHTVAVGGGELPCNGCGAPIVIPGPESGESGVSCNKCDLYVARIGIG
jgi:hypothetical protein